ncbi:polysaccharide deacetylase family protein [Bosea sp. BH3]|uniref:polysaccharide deacetylase family protein n=1 Tax=Bosea sp. BH3 TaxID=2871701 RepID=UPI0021CAFA5B|nr:polysaccharide deacetylase family protein [Bosea sp. BH3]MCU4178294.1 polysaccharide deacetylase family protein [Bosea sp. BH3]
MTDDPWQALHNELDRWSQNGRQLRLWLRDDDTVAPSPALSRLSDLAERFDAPVLLAVIPLLAEPALAPALRDMPLLRPCQHGTWHRNHTAAEGKKSEFGSDREPSVVDAEIALGRQRLTELLGPAILPIFVPPWNRIDPGHAARLPAAGFDGLSCFRGYRLGADGGPRLINTHVDVMDWQGGRIGRRPDALLAEIVARLAAERDASRTLDTHLGLLLHHRDHDETVWAFLSAFLGTVSAHPAARLVDPGALLNDAPFPA